MQVKGVVYLLNRGGGEWDIVFRPLQDGQFRPRRRFKTERGAFLFLVSELALPLKTALRATRSGVHAPVYVNLAEEQVEALWPDWRLRPRPAAAAARATARLAWQMAA